MKLHARNSNGNKDGSLQRKNYLDDCLDKFDVLLLVNDGEVSLADVPQSENLLLLLNFSSSSRLLDRRAVLLASSQILSPLGSRGALLLLHVVNGGPQSSVNNGILFQMEFQPSTSFMSSMIVW